MLPGTTLHTDQWHACWSFTLRGYHHETCNHEQEQRVNPQGTTVIELDGFWRILKRDINDTHIHVSAKHLPKNLGEFEYRWNMRNVPHLMLDRLMHSFVR